MRSQIADNSMRLTIVTLFLLLLTTAPLTSLANQVFEVAVDVNTSQITTTDYEYIAELAPLIKEYFETNSWTEDRFLEVERIRVNIQIAINAVEERNFSATMVISTERPIYNSMQVSPVLVLSENSWSFSFSSSQTLLFDSYQYHDIASVLDFYANLILGFDYDTYSEKGGEEFFQSAQRVAELGQSAGSGWTSTGTRRSRYDLISQLLNPNYEDFRIALYHYHRNGLDMFTRQPDQSRDNILEAFEMIHQSQRRTTGRYVFDLLFAAKHREFRAIFMDADTERRLDAYNVLTTIDDSRISEYERLQR